MLRKLHHAFRITCLGVYLSGEGNLKKGTRSESNMPAIYEGRRMKMRVVTWIRPESDRSNP